MPAETQALNGLDVLVLVALAVLIIRLIWLVVTD